MAAGLSAQVRALAVREYVEPARRNGGKIVIVIGEIQEKLLREGFPPNHTRQIYTSLESKRHFQDPFGLILETPIGQPVRVGTELRFRVANNYESKMPKGHESKRPSPAYSGTALIEPPQKVGESDIHTETSEEWAARLAGKLSGLLKDEIAAFGGAEGFMEWVRSDHDQEEAK